MSAAREGEPIGSLEVHCRQLARGAGLDPDGRDSRGMLHWVRFLEQARAELNPESAPDPADAVGVARLSEVKVGAARNFGILAAELLHNVLPKHYAEGVGWSHEHQVCMEGAFKTSDGVTHRLEVNISRCMCDDCKAKQAARG